MEVFSFLEIRDVGILCRVCGFLNELISNTRYGNELWRRMVNIYADEKDYSQDLEKAKDPNKFWKEICSQLGTLVWDVERKGTQINVKNEGKTLFTGKLLAY